MEFLRRHLFFLICGLGGIGGVALGITGYNAMDQVTKEMAHPRKLFSDLAALSRKPVNQAIIDRERARIDRIVANRNAVVAQARSLTRYKPLRADVFPDGNVGATEAFRKAYAKHMHDLMDTLAWGELTWGGVATPQGIEIMKAKLARDEQSETSWSGESTRVAHDVQPAAPPMTPAGVLTQTGAERNFVARAHLAVARLRYCYATSFDDPRPRIVPSLRFAEPMRDTGRMEAVLLEDCWAAQVQYWIYADVIAAIRALNDEAAGRIASQGGKPWVGVLPVKDIISVRLANADLYVTDDPAQYAMPSAAGPDAAAPPGNNGSYFTQTVGSDDYDVVQFSVKLVMDQRSVLEFVDHLYRDSFHTLLRVAYVTVEPNRAMIGKIYGPDPVVQVVMDFETVMLAEPFRRWMPQETLDEYGWTRPEAEDIDG